MNAERKRITIDATFACLLSTLSQMVSDASKQFQMIPDDESASESTTSRIHPIPQRTSMSASVSASVSASLTLVVEQHLRTDRS